VARNEYENRADGRVKKREQREERSEPSHNVVENGKQPQMLFVFVHSLKGCSVSCSSSCSPANFESEDHAQEQEHEHE
jgi:hypothetical protein